MIITLPSTIHQINMITVIMLLLFVSINPLIHGQEIWPDENNNEVIIIDIVSNEVPSKAPSEVPSDVPNDVPSEVRSEAPSEEEDNNDNVNDMDWRFYANVIPWNCPKPIITNPTMVYHGSGCDVGNDKCTCTMRGALLHMSGRGTPSTATGLDFECKFDVGDARCSVWVDIPWGLASNHLRCGCTGGYHMVGCDISNSGHTFDKKIHLIANNELLPTAQMAQCAAPLLPEVNCLDLSDDKTCKIKKKKCKKKLPNSMEKCKKECKKDAKRNSLCQKTCCKLGFTK